MIVSKIYLDMDDVLVDFKSAIKDKICNLVFDSKNPNYSSNILLKRFKKQISNYDMNNIHLSLRKCLDAKDQGFDLHPVNQLLYEVSYIPIRNNKDFWLSMKPNHYAQDLINTSIDLVGFENVTLLTAPVDRDCVIGKQEWIEKNLPEFQNKVIYSKNKHYWSRSNSVLIDDRIKNTKKWSHYGGISILHKNYNQTLDELLAVYSN